MKRQENLIENGFYSFFEGILRHCMTLEQVQVQTQEAYKYSSFANCTLQSSCLSFVGS